MNVTQLTHQRKSSATRKALPKAKATEPKPEAKSSEPTDKVETSAKPESDGLTIPSVPPGVLGADPMTIAATVGGMFAWAVAKKLIGALADKTGDLIIKILKGKGKKKKPKKAEKALQNQVQPKVALQSITTQSGQSQEVAARGSVNAPQTMAILA